jgi:adenylate cyclase
MPVNLADGSRIRIANNELIFIHETSGTVDSEAFAATLAASMDQSEAAPRMVAILVCDIRGFSTISESVPPDLLAPFLGQWFREAGNIVQQVNGIVDKFIGDAMLAYWPQTESDPGNECITAFKVGKQLLELATKRRWPQLNLPFQIAVALHHGRVTFGNIGLVAQRDATIIGDAVNTAFRIEGIMKQLGQRLVASESFAEILPDRTGLADLGEKELKGKAQRVRIFGLE